MALPFAAEEEKLYQGLADVALELGQVVELEQDWADLVSELFVEIPA